jgi:hypothetical protein
MEHIWPVVTTDEKARLPFWVDGNLENKVASVILFVSMDEGRTWEQVGEIRAISGAFSFKFPRYGVYWFRIQKIMKDGSKLPKDVRCDSERPLVVSYEPEKPKHRISPPAP